MKSADIAKGFKVYSINDLVEMGFAETRHGVMSFIKSGKLDYFKPGKEYKFTQDQVNRFIEKYSSNNI